MRFTSILGVFCSVYAAILLVSQVSSHAPEGHVVVAPTNGLWNALPTINVAYSLHYNGTPAGIEDFTSFGRDTARCSQFRYVLFDAFLWWAAHVFSDLVWILWK